MVLTRLSRVAQVGSWTASGLLLLTSAYVFLRRRRHRLAPQPNDVAPGVYCLVTGPRFLPSNVYFVRSGSSWVLIDTAWAKSGAWLGLVPKGSLFVWQHALMVPAMVVVRLFRLDLYTARMSYHAHAHPA